VKSLLRLWVTAGSLLTALPASAQPGVPLPPVNLGGSSFTDAIAHPGVIARNAVTATHAPRFVGTGGETVPGEHQLSTVVNLVHAGFLAPGPSHSAWGADVLVPLVFVDVRHDGHRAQVFGVGDILLTPLMVQLPTLQLGDGLQLFQRGSATAILPVGASPGAGSGVWGINPYWAATLMGERAEVSARLHWLWSSPRADGAQPGQAVHFNVASSVAITSGLRAGLAGYYLQQATAARGSDGAALAVRERVAGVGPGVSLRIGNWRATFNAYVELGAESRPTGVRGGLSVTKAWPVEAPTSVPSPIAATSAPR
jgi:hypothetical protein